jgi:hypothetical protein
MPERLPKGALFVSVPKEAQGELTRDGAIKSMVEVKP